MALQMNGTTFYPSSVRRTKVKIGEGLEADDGTRRWVQRNHKHIFDIGWIGVSNAIRTQILTVFNLTTTFTLVDVDGSSFTCQCEADGYSQYTDADHYTPAGGGSLRYDITLKVYEA